MPGVIGGPKGGEKASTITSSDGFLGRACVCERERVVVTDRFRAYLFISGLPLRRWGLF